MKEKYLIIRARWNDAITSALEAGAVETFAKHGVKKSAVEIVSVPGSFELPVAAAAAAKSGRYAAIICLGCVIRGDTPHFDYVAGEAASGIMKVSVETRVPVIFGVLTTENADQALARCGVTGDNKGCDAAEAAMEMVQVVKKLGAKK